MGIFDFLKKKKKNPVYTIKFEETSVFSHDSNEDFEGLTTENKLPWGWIMHNQEFTGKIGGEYTHFLNQWLDAKSRSPRELYATLKSFVVYLEDAERLCKSKGEHFEYWYYNILTAPDYLKKRKNELKELTENLDELQEVYEKKQNLFPAVIELLKSNDGILQSEFKQLFDEPFQNEVSNILYNLHKEGKLERIKEGRTYILHFRG